MRVLFLHGAPAAHPVHAALARSVGADFLVADRHLPLSAGSSRARRYLSWAVNAARLPLHYDVFLTESTQVPPVLARKLGRLKARQRVVALMADHTLYFLRAGRYPRATHRLLVRLLRSLDALVCIGDMQTRIAAEILGEAAPAPLILPVRSMLGEDRRRLMEAARPDLESSGLVFVGNGPDGFRAHYKGIDLLLQTASLLRERGHRFGLRIVGSWEPAFVRTLLASHPGAAEWTSFLGERADPAPCLSGAGLYVHLARGEAWGVTVLEAMAAGLPALVSEWTGSQEAVARVDPRLVVPLDPSAAASRIEWYWGLSVDERRSLSHRAVAVASEYTEAAALRRFEEALREAAAPR